MNLQIAIFPTKTDSEPHKTKIISHENESFGSLRRGKQYLVRNSTTGVGHGEKQSSSMQKTRFQAKAMKKRQTVPHVHDVTSLLQRRATVALFFRRHYVVT